jgi:hypothetical protein
MADSTAKAAMTFPDDETSRDAQRAAADYVAALVMELALIARGHRLDTLGYLLDVARLEAESVSRSNGRGS